MRLLAVLQDEDNRSELTEQVLEWRFEEEWIEELE
jgi:hypothetical protein